MAGWNVGQIDVSLNDRGLYSVGPNKKETKIGFEFNDGDVLKIAENKAIIQFNSLRIIGCPIL